MDKKFLFLGFFIIAGIVVFFLLLFAVFQIWGYLTYETKAEKELWIAKDKILVTREFITDEENSFMVEKNEVCIPMRTIHEKDFDYTEILCEKGQGWITSKSDFNVLSPKKTKLR
jgi:16S rRNA U516 pseudouridylate synthase RsuA-like enzyme